MAIPSIESLEQLRALFSEKNMLDSGLASQSLQRANLPTLSNSLATANSINAEQLKRRQFDYGTGVLKQQEQLLQARQPYNALLDELRTKITGRHRKRDSRIVDLSKQLFGPAALSATLNKEGKILPITKFLVGRGITSPVPGASGFLREISPAIGSGRGSFRPGDYRPTPLNATPAAPVSSLENLRKQLLKKR